MIDAIYLGSQIAVLYPPPPRVWCFWPHEDWLADWFQVYLAKWAILEHKVWEMTA